MSLVNPNAQHFRTADDRAAWLKDNSKGDAYARILTATVLHNPAGAYEVLKRSFPSYPTLSRGGEQSQASQIGMITFLEQAAQTSGDALQFAVEFSASVPNNPRMDGLWLIVPKP